MKRQKPIRMIQKKKKTEGQGDPKGGSHRTKPHAKKRNPKDNTPEGMPCMRTKREQRW